MTLDTARGHHTATLLPNGKLLVAAGTPDGGYNFFASAELYDVGLRFSSASQPMISKLKLNGGRRLLLTGSVFQGISQASGLKRKCNVAAQVRQDLFASVRWGG